MKANSFFSKKALTIITAFALLAELLFLPLYETKAPLLQKMLRKIITAI